MKTLNYTFEVLFLTDAEYAAIPTTRPFVAPTYPASLSIPTTSTTVEELQLKDAHSERKKYG